MSIETLRDVVAIDGPSGAGKSTVARGLARRLGCPYLDTGAMYRAVTWYLLQRDACDFADGSSVAPLLGALDIALDAEGRVTVSGRDVSSHLRSHEVERRVSAVSALSVVRKRMRELQRAMAEHGLLVAEGRDMGSVVFPAANWKFYLDAAPSERARRRQADFLAQGREVSQDDVLEEILVRDRLDSTRPDAPLTCAEGATRIDTTSMGVDEVIEHLARIVERERT
ncbi:MAG: (d)CMP kinase [Planctomycetes bacterium]|nr:(d)CMP kinase [Planctomycetota bacterium]